MPRNLDLALIGNGAIGLLVDPVGAVVWGCFPRFDGDPTFCALLDDTPRRRRSAASATIELVDVARARAGVRRATPRCSSRGSSTRRGGAIEITDCVPRFLQHGRMFHPMTHRAPRAARRRQPAHRRAAAARRRTTGARIPTITVGSSHIRYVRAGADAAPHDRRVAHRDPRGAAVLPRATRCTLLLGPDETVPSAVDEVGRRFIEETIDVLARLGAPARDPVRMAGRGDPRGDHAAAQRVRRHRRDRRRDDHVDPRGARTRRATGTIATAGCATATSSSTR